MSDHSASPQDTDAETSKPTASTPPAATQLRIGGHGDSQDPVLAAQQRHATAAQFFVGDPQGWKAPQVAYPAGAAALKETAQQAGITLIVHAPYVLNVATTNNRIRIPSRKLLQQYLDTSAQCGAQGLIVHGGHVSKGDDPAEGVANWAKALERTTTPIPILLENTAGGDFAMARSFDRLAQVWDAAAGAAEKSGAELGFCLDTCHAHAAGEKFAGLIERVLAITGRLDVMHVNDSRDEFGSGADRHANIGKGKINPDELFGVIQDAVNATNPVLIVETAGDAAGQGADIAWVRESLAAGKALPVAQVHREQADADSGQTALKLD